MVQSHTEGCDRFTVWTHGGKQTTVHRPYHHLHGAPIPSVKTPGISLGPRYDPVSDRRPPGQSKKPLSTPLRIGKDGLGLLRFSADLKVGEWKIRHSTKPPVLETRRDRNSDFTPIIVMNSSPQQSSLCTHLCTLNRWFHVPYIIREPLPTDSTKLENPQSKTYTFYSPVYDTLGKMGDQSFRISGRHRESVK